MSLATATRSKQAKMLARWGLGARGGIYIVMCLILSGIAKWLEIRTRRSSKLKGYTPHTGDRDPRINEESTVTEVIAMQRGAGKFDGTNTGLG